MIDIRPYPRCEPCPRCHVTMVDVIGPGDTWALCAACHMALMDEASGHDEMLVRCGTFDRALVEQYARWAMDHPGESGAAG